MALRPVETDLKVAARNVVSGLTMFGIAALGANAASIASASFTPAYAQSQSKQTSVRFTAQECLILNRLLVNEMQEYKGRPNDPASEMSRTLPLSTISFIGLDRKQMACDGPAINWSTRGDKSILDAVYVGLSLLEGEGKVPKGLTKRFDSIVAKTATVASLSPQKISAPSVPVQPQ